MTSAAVALAGASGCASNSYGSGPASVSELRFQDAVERARFLRLHACFAARASTRGWHYHSLERIGNFVREEWCRGLNLSHGCGTTSFRAWAGSEWYELSTFHYTDRWPVVHGISVNAGRLPPDADWGIRFYYAVDPAETIVANQLDVYFVPMKVRRLGAKEVHLGDNYSYDVGETKIVVEAPGGEDRELARIVASPDSLRDTALARVDALELEIRRTLDAGLATKCVDIQTLESSTNPKFQECSSVPLTAEEREHAWDDAERELAERRQTVRAHAAIFHRTLVEFMQFDRCW